MENIVQNQNIENTKIATARWADPSYIAEQYKWTPGKIWLGRNPHNENEAIGYLDDSHVFLCAGTRKGKGRAFIINNILKWPGSMVSVDPKGENATITAVRRGPGNKYCDGMKQNTYVLDPMHCAKVPKSLRAYYNLLDALDPNDEDLLVQTDLIADAICIIKEGTEAAEWAEYAREYISTIIAHVVTYPAYEGRRDLITVRKLIIEGEVYGAECLKEAGKDISPFEVLIDDIIHNKACDGEIASLGRDIIQNKKDTPKYFESTRKTAAAQTAFLKSKKMQRTVSNTGYYKRTFDISKLKDSKKGVSIFLSLPERNSKINCRWQRAMISVLFGEITEKQGNPANGHQMLFSIDEFQSLGKLDEMVSAADSAAGGGIKLMIGTQRLSSLQKLYKEDYEAFLTNSGLQIWFAADGPTTKKHLQEELGQTQIVLKIKSVNKSESETFTDSETEGTTHTDNTSTTKSDSKNWSKSENRNKTENWNLGQSWNKGQSLSHTDTWNRSKNSNISNSSSQTDTWNHGTNSSKSQNYGQTKTWNRGKSLNNSKNYGQTDTWTSGINKNITQAYSESGSWNEGINWGNSENWGESEGKQAGKNYGPHAFFEREPDTDHPHTFSDGENYNRSKGYTKSGGGSSSKGGSITKGDTRSQGENSSHGGSTTKGNTYSQGENSSHGGSITKGKTNTLGENFSKGGSTTQGETRSQGESLSLGGSITKGETNTHGETFSKGGATTKGEARSQGGSKTTSSQTGESDSHQKSKQTSHGNTYQIGGSFAEQYHKKPLLAVNEINTYFASPQKRDNPAYPGMALIMISEELPFFIRKANYDQDPEFARCFNPNPKYLYTPREKQPLLGYQYTGKNYLNITIPKLIIDYGYYLPPVIQLKKGQKVKMHEELFSFKKALSEWEKIDTPFDGTVMNIAERDQYKENGYVMTIRYEFSLSQKDKALLHDYFWEKTVKIIINEFTRSMREANLVIEILRKNKRRYKRKKWAMINELKGRLWYAKKCYDELKKNLHTLMLKGLVASVRVKELERELEEEARKKAVEEKESKRAARLAEFKRRLKKITQIRERKFKENQEENKKLKKKREKSWLEYTYILPVLFISCSVPTILIMIELGFYAIIVVVPILVATGIIITTRIKGDEKIKLNFKESNSEIKKAANKNIDDLKKEFSDISDLIKYYYYKPET
ncbi:MAG: type IV secretory system conjugative DNA transfer family protein [Deltaproteobacteria bacterium]|nr:type IV secretory system conjugative DNA transfer family protein [Deltaproteobacteria bacterium]